VGLDSSTSVFIDYGTFPNKVAATYAKPRATVAGLRGLLGREQNGRIRVQVFGT
jgi:hypothetical protein